MSIQTIDNEKIKAYCHETLPDIPEKSATEMKQFFDAMPKKVLIPKINEIVDELNSGNYGKSAYQLAVELGFEGSEQEWLLSLKGQKGDSSITITDSTDNITAEGVYDVGGELYLAKNKEWDREFSTVVSFDGGAIDNSALSTDKSSIPNSSDLFGYPILKYKNPLGDGSGGTYLFLGENCESFIVFIADTAQGAPVIDDRTGPYYLAEDMDMSDVVTLGLAYGKGEDICGNWARISGHFSSELAIERYVSQSELLKLSNTLEGSAYGTAVAITDASPIAHEMDVRISYGSTPNEVTVLRYGKNLLPYPYVDTTKTVNGVTFTDNGDGSITINGTATADTNFILSYHVSFGSDVINAINKVSSNGTHTASHRLFYTPSNAYLPVSIVIGKDVTVNETVYPQIELGSEATDYERYKAPVHYTPENDGRVKGIFANGESISLLTDKKNAIVSVKYNKDINKTVSALQNEIAKLKGGV